jgi:sulfur relay (sulfurtransferase) complex TusBCD TusD component (DsrE family)
MGELTIMLTTGAMMGTGAYKAARLAEAAMAKGHTVNLFCYGEGITALKRGQAPKRFANVSDMFSELMTKGLNVAACQTCLKARGYTADDLIEGAIFGGLSMQFIEYANRSDRIVHISF